MKTRIANIVLYTIGIAIVVLPFVYSQKFADPVLLPRFLFMSIALLLGQLLALIGLFGKTRDKNQSSKLPIPFLVCILVYISSVILSTIWAHQPTESLVEIGRSLFFVNSLLFFYQLFQSNKNHISFIAKCIVIACSFIVATGLIDVYAQQNNLQTDKTLYFINALMAHKNLLASALFLGLPFAGYLFFIQSNQNKYLTQTIFKYFSLLVLVLSFVLILIVQSRAVWLAILVVLFLCPILYFIFKPQTTESKEYKNKSKKRIFQIAIPLVLFCGSLLFLQQTYFSKLNPQNSIKNRLVSMIQFKEVKNEHTETINERLALWDNSWELIKDNPLTGVGAGNWKFFFPSKGMSGLRSEQGQVNFQRPHNDYLWIWSESGLFALLGWLGLFILSLFYAYKVLKYNKEKEDFYLLLCVAMGIVGFAVFSFFDFPKERCWHLLLLGILMAIPLALYQSTNKTAQQNRMVYIVLGIFVSLVCIFIFGLKSLGEMPFVKAMQARQSKNYPAMLSYLDEAEKWNYNFDPTAIPLDWYRGEYYYFAKDYQSALQYFQQTIAKHPYQIVALNNLAGTHYALKNNEKAEYYFKEALKFAPGYGESNLNLAAIYFNQGKRGEAERHLLACPPDFDEGRYPFFLQKILAPKLDSLTVSAKSHLLKSRLELLKGDVKWLTAIHKDYIEYKTVRKTPATIEDRILANVIYALKQDGLVKDGDNIE